MNIEDLNKLQAFREANTLDREAIMTGEQDEVMCIAYRNICIAESNGFGQGMDHMRQIFTENLSNTIIEKL
jgi:hypothetical protein